MTSFSPAGYEQYGKRMLETFSKHWPGKIVVYFEEKPDFEHEKVEYRDLYDIPGLSAFLEKLKTVAGADGISGGQYDYRWDANKFCRKVFAQDDAFNLGNEVFWLDADSVALKAIPKEFLSALIEGVPFCYFGREKSYTETGFIGFNTEHPDFHRFMAAYRSCYETGKIFTQLIAWHDCIAFDIAREGIKGNNLSPDARGMQHVIPGSSVGKYIDHLKGPIRKARGYSHERV